ncbi:45345_t:CDS:1, partial [Gigaspora margarita]
LVISELKATKKFDLKQEAIIEEMKQIKVKFEFWQKKGSKNWQYTSLTGNDKFKILYEFNLSQIFLEECAIIIHQLWNNFAKLYKSLKDPQVTGIQF